MEEFWSIAGRAAREPVSGGGRWGRGAGRPPSVIPLLPPLCLCRDVDTSGFMERVFLKG